MNNNLKTEILNSFKNQWKRDKMFPLLFEDLSKEDKDFYMLSNKKGFVVLNLKKNKIVRLEKIDRSIKVKELIELAFEHLSLLQPIYIYVNTSDKGLIDRLEKLNFTKNIIIKNKYKLGDEFIKMEWKENESCIKS